MSSPSTGVWIRPNFLVGYQPDADWLEILVCKVSDVSGRQILTLPGRLTRLKGHTEFIDLIAGLVQAGVDVHGLIVGHLDPARQAYINELRQLVVDKGLVRADYIYWSAR